MKQIKHDKIFALTLVSIILAHLVAISFLIWTGLQGQMEWMSAAGAIAALFVLMNFLLYYMVTNYSCGSCDHIVSPPRKWWNHLFGLSFNCWRCDIEWYTGMAKKEPRRTAQLNLNQASKPTRKELSGPEKQAAPGE